MAEEWAEAFGAGAPVSDAKDDALYTLYYWPIPFRGVMIESLLAYKDVPYNTATMDEVMKIYTAPAAEQPTPMRAPPFLTDHADGFTISQLSAIALYISHKHGLMPESLQKQSLAMKVLNDANDVLAEICRANGDVKKDGDYVMWDRLAWDEFIDGKFVKWLVQFESTARKFGCTADGGFLLGTPEASLADLTCHALWATMARCLPELAPRIDEHAPTVMALCARLEQSRGLASLVGRHRASWGTLYCGGMIEKSIREMLAPPTSGEAAGEAEGAPPRKVGRVE